MGGTWLRYGLSVVTLFAASLSGCKDPPGDTGGLVLVIRTFEAPPESNATDVQRIVVNFNRVELVHRDTPDGEEDIVTVDDQPRTIELVNENSEAANTDTLVGFYQVPIGYVVQARIRPTSVVAYFRDGSNTDLPVENPTLPSWRQSGWKISADDGTLFPITTDELTGMRGLMRFGDRFVRPNNPNGLGIKIKPTIDAELFDPNPSDGEPGLFLDQLVVVLKPGVPQAALDALNAPIRAVVLRTPVLSNAYQVRFPAPTTIRDAYRIYTNSPDVQGVLPMIRFRLLATPDEAQNAHSIAGLNPTAWGFVEQSVGTVGTSRVQIAMHDSAFNVAHPEIANNIEINQGELPPALFDFNANGVVDASDIASIDTDGDGLITFYDLNNPGFTGPTPADFNHNGFFDGVDLIHDDSWANKVDDDDFDSNPNTFVDDLVGWDFERNNNDVAPNPSDTTEDLRKHGTLTSQVAAGIGNNGVGIAGTAWRATIVPIQGALTTAEFMDASRYVEARGIPIMNASYAYDVASKDADLTGANKKEIRTGVPVDDYNKALDTGRAAFRTLPWIDPDLDVPRSRTLYVFAAGNENVNIGQTDVYSAPAEFLRPILPDQVIIAGNAASLSQNDGQSNYGFNVNLWAPGTWEVIPYQAFDPNALPPKVAENGTSLAAPCVAGVAALVFARFPTLSPTDVQTRLVSTAGNTLNVEIGGVLEQQNRPVINACHALAADALEELQCPSVGP